jgi:alpha-2-macroglobulin
LVGTLSYESTASQKSTLPINIKRKLYRLSPQGSAEFSAEPVPENWELRADELYADVIELEQNQGISPKYGLLLVPLSPGAEVEQTTWGLKIIGSDSKELEISSRVEPSVHAYAVPIDELESQLTSTHLVRFSQPGKFRIPPVRFYKMYAPHEQAFEGGDSAALREVTVR